MYSTAHIIWGKKKRGGGVSERDLKPASLSANSHLSELKNQKQYYVC